MKSETNFDKARHDIYAVGRMLKEYQRGFEYKRLSPSIQQFVCHMVEATGAIADALGEHRDIAVELNVWEQMSMTFPTRAFDEDGNPLNEE